MPPLKSLDRWRSELSGVSGRGRWEALQRLASLPDFPELLSQDFPALANAAAMNRRGFFKFAAASLALAGLAGCGHPPQEQIVPMRRQEGPDADNPRYYATALPFDGYASPVLALSHGGRPTKIEGNPRHPASLGSTDIFSQAAVLDLWDPDRSQSVLKNGIPSSWDEFLAAVVALTPELQRSQGQGFHILSGALTSPTLRDQLRQLRRRYPLAQHHVWQPWPRDNVYAGTALAFGEPLEPRYRFDRAEVIVALDADFLGGMPGRVRYARDFIDGRRVQGSEGARMNRLYALECTSSLTGAMADHRLSAGFQGIGACARRLAAALGLDLPAELPAAQARWIDALAADLRRHPGAALVVAGEAQPPAVHALAHAINAALGAPGNTVDYLAPLADPVAAFDSTRELATAMAAGSVGLLLMLDVDPVYDAPADLRFGAALDKVGCSVHLGQYAGETAAASTWHIPQAHPLESWSDLCAADGSCSIVQPLLEPLYGGRTAHELVAVFDGAVAPNSYRLVRDYWNTRATGEFERFWKDALAGGVANAPPPPRPATLRRDAVTAAAASLSGDNEALRLLFRPDPTVWDGRYANNGWLQELPKPGTQLTWNNAILVSTTLARRLNLNNGDEISLRTPQGEATGAAWISGGQAPNTITAFLGYGRERGGRLGSGLGFNASRLRHSSEPWCAPAVELHPTGRHLSLAATQHEFRMEEREPVRSATLADFKANPQAIRHGPREDGPFPSLYPERPPGAYSWAMHIDLNACTGCKVCTIACQAENNIPVVGADQVRLGRAMHWIRVDQYEGKQAGDLLHQPVPCMHCEHAPCELVCPVGATVHDSEGLNLQVYNRCVGTRFCSNNCPYKVRRFNFLQYSDLDTESLKGARNPEVTVRNRGVMEKCTYCIQRIRVAEIAAEKDNRRLGDGEVRTACQAACPTQAIRFGDLQDPASAVVEARSTPLHYSLLAELNTRPRTTYSARLRNPNPAMPEEEWEA